MTDNPFFAPSPLPYGLPPFAEIRAEHYRPALEAGMAEQLTEIARIAAKPEPATFENTVVALERTGVLLRRVLAVFENHAATDTNPLVQELDAEFKLKLAAHRDAVHLDRALFARVDAVHAERAGLDLDAESLRLVERHHSRFVRAGAQLAEDDQRRLRELNAELAAATAEFGQNLHAANAAGALVLEHVEELAGCSEEAIAAAADNAWALGYEGKYVLSLLNFTEQPALAQLTNREVRRRLLAASADRALATNGPVAARMAALRAERAALFGHPSHAAYVVADETAGSVAAVTELLERLVPPAVANAEQELARLRAAAEADGVTDFGPHDLPFYAERVRLAEYDLDSAALRPYYELERVLRDGVFHAAGLVYGLTFTERTDLVGYHPDTRVFEVFEQDGRPLGLFLADFFARPSKRGGAWMSELVMQNGLFDQQPVVYNNLNLTKPAPGRPVLLSDDEVRTLFHEFGHALHGLFSAVRYPCWPAPRCRATSWSSPRRSTRCGRTGPRCGPTTPGTTRAGIRCRPSWWTGSPRPGSSARACGPSPTWPPPCWTGPGTPCRPVNSSRTRPPSRPKRWSGPGWPFLRCRRATAAPTSATCSSTATARATTPTSGRRCWTPTRWSGSAATGARSARAARCSGASCSAGATRCRRWRPSARWSAASPTPRRCWPGVG